MSAPTTHHSQCVSCDRVTSFNGNIETMTATVPPSCMAHLRIALATVIFCCCSTSSPVGACCFCRVEGICVHALPPMCPLAVRLRDDLLHGDIETSYISYGFPPSFTHCGSYIWCFLWCYFFWCHHRRIFVLLLLRSFVVVVAFAPFRSIVCPQGSVSLQPFASDDLLDPLTQAQQSSHFWYHPNFHAYGIVDSQLHQRFDRLSVVFAHTVFTAFRLGIASRIGPLCSYLPTSPTTTTTHCATPTNQPTSQPTAT